MPRFKNELVSPVFVRQHAFSRTHFVLGFVFYYFWKKWVFWKVWKEIEYVRNVNRTSTLLKVYVRGVKNLSLTKLDDIIILCSFLARMYTTYIHTYLVRQWDVKIVSDSCITFYE